MPGDFRKKALAATQAPSDDERRLLRERGLELRQRLAGGGSASSAAIARLINGWPAYGADAQSAAMSLAGYLETLKDLPAWAVEEAVTRFRRNKAVTSWAAGKMPDEAQMSAEVEAIIAPLAFDLHRITEILRAEVYQPMSDAERAKMDKAISDWTAKRRLSQGRPVKAETPEEFDARLREIGRVEGLTLSEAAR